MKCKYLTSEKTQCIYIMLYIDGVGHPPPSQKCLSHSTWLLPPVLVMEEGIKTYSAFPALLVSPNLQSSNYSP